MHFHILHIEKEAEADPRDVYISLFCVPDIIVHHLKHELHHGSHYGSVCPTNNC